MFALVREAAKRVLGERPYDEQLIGGIILNNGVNSRDENGEGKTLVSTLPAYLNSLRKGAYSYSKRLLGKKRFGLDG